MGAHSHDVNRLLSLPARLARAVGREIAAIIKFGAVANAAAPTGQPAQSHPAAAIAGATLLQSRDEESESSVR